MFAKLFELQKKLDDHITAEHGLENENLLDKKILALLVELGELANETRCFKFWSKKPASSPNIILEEYVDGIHFILSIGLDLQFQDQLQLSPAKEKGEIVNQFQRVFSSIIDFRQKKDLENYHKVFHEYILLGKILGFSEKEITEAYKKKNEVNHKRQEQGY